MKVGRSLRPYLAMTAVLALVLGIAAAGAVAPSHNKTSTAAGGGDQQATVGGVPIGDSGTPGSTGQVAQGAATSHTPGALANQSATPRGGGSQQQPVYDQGVTDSTILIGGSTFTSGPAAVYGDQIAVGFAAGIDYINQHGGINGRRVLLKVYDDGGDPTRQLENTKRLVEVDKVFALSMVYSPIAAPYTDTIGIPVFHEGQFDTDFYDPWWFSLGGPQDLSAFSLSNFGARTKGVKSVAIFYLDAGVNNYSKAFANQVANDWKAYGVKVPVMDAFTPYQTSCSNAISDASAAKVDFIDFEIDASKVVNCAIGAQIQGYKPPKSWGGYLIGVPAVWQALGDESIGMYALDAFGAIYNSPDYQQAVHKVSAKTDTDSSVTAAYFVAAMLMRDGIAKLGNVITREHLRQVLDTFTNWQPGLTTDANQPRWTWTPTCHIAIRGGYIIQVQKQADGSLAWTQVTPQGTSNPVPPGVAIPPLYSGCHVFSNG